MKLGAGSYTLNMLPHISNDALMLNTNKNQLD